MIPSDITPQELVNAQHWAAVWGVWLPAITALIAVVGIVVSYWIHETKERSDRQEAAKVQVVSLLRNFTDDLYGNTEIATMFSDIRLGRPLNISAQESPDRTTLARLLETINLVGVMLAKGMIRIQDVANSSIAYFTLCVCEHPDVQRFLQEMDDEHKTRGHPSPAFVEAKSLAESLKKFAAERDRPTANKANSGVDCPVGSASATSSQKA